ncbi:MAG TPA: type II toxin-antitoxin system RelE/ParE family toxin [Candidatus Tectomicrobia bacterium]
MSWHVELTEDAAAEIAALPADMRAHFLRIAGLLEEFGPHKVREPHVKPLEDKLWEIRMKGKDGIARAIYFTARGQRLVVVRAFIKKTQKTPQREMALASERMQTYLALPMRNVSRLIN